MKPLAAHLAAHRRSFPVSQQDAQSWQFALFLLELAIRFRLEWFAIRVRWHNRNGTPRAPVGFKPEARMPDPPRN